MVTCTTPPFRAAVRLNSGVSHHPDISRVRRILYYVRIAWAVLVSALGLRKRSSVQGLPESAHAIFDLQQRLFSAFDPAVASLYSDSAVIRNTRRYPDGQVRVLEMDGAKYKALLVASLPAAKLRGDTSRLSSVTYFPEQLGVRVNAIRFSDLKQYSSPVSLLIGPDQDGDWCILEEISESRP